MSQPRRVTEWEHAMHRKNFKATKWSRVCSVHFQPECFNRTGQTVRLREDATPTIINVPERLQKTVKERKPPANRCHSTDPPSTSSATAPNYLPETSTLTAAMPFSACDHTYALPSPQKLKRN